MRLVEQIARVYFAAVCRKARELHPSLKVVDFDDDTSDGEFSRQTSMAGADAVLRLLEQQGVVL